MASIADAPSLICELFPAVIRPSGVNDGFSPARASSVLPGRIPSSRSTMCPSSGMTSPVSRFSLRAGSATISSANCPSAVAFAARSWLRTLNVSHSVREMPHRCAISSADRPWLILPRTSKCCWPAYRWSAPGPNGAPYFGSEVCARNGTLLITSTPPAITTSHAPDMTACAAKCAACWDEPHCRSIVVPGIASGHPAASTADRATFSACAPTWFTHPTITSSMTAGSIPVRCAKASKVLASKSTGCQPARAP